MFAALPDFDSLDLESAKALLRAQHAALSSGTGEIERLKLLVDKLQRMLFGSKSERVFRQIEQLELRLEELEAAGAVEDAKATPTPEPRAAAKPFRRRCPSICRAKC